MDGATHHAGPLFVCCQTRLCIRVSSAGQSHRPVWPNLDGKPTARWFAWHRIPQIDVPNWVSRLCVLHMNGGQQQGRKREGSVPDEAGPENCPADQKSNFCAAALERICHPDKIEARWMAMQ